MKFNFKKIVSVLASTVMLGSTMGFATAASAYPAPFVSGGVADAGIVYGGQALLSDLVGASSINANLQYNLATQTATSTASSTSVSGGDSVDLSTSNTKLYYNNSLNAARSSLSRTEMPTLLADGTFKDDDGSEFGYTQSITVNSTGNVQFSTSGGDLSDPELLIQLGTTRGAPVYIYKLSFSKNVNLSSATSQGNAITIMGKSYIVGANTMKDGTLYGIYLYGGGNSATLNEGESKVVTLAGKEYTVSVKGISSTPQAYVTVNGEEKKVSEGSTYKFGDMEVYIKTIYYLGKESQVSYVTLELGAKKLTLEQGKTVKSGADDTSIRGTNVTISNTTGGVVSSVMVDIAAQESKTDHIAIGGTFLDPVFGGLELKFASVVPALDATSRDTITIDTDGNKNARVTFTPYISKAGTFSYARDKSSTSGTVTTYLNDSSGKAIHVVEGERAGENEYIIINSGDYGRILKVESINIDYAANDYVKFVDALDSTQNWKISGNFSMGTTTCPTAIIDGQTYYINASNTGASGNVRVTWGTGANCSQMPAVYNAGSAAGGAGAATTVFPRIKLKNGEFLTFLTDVIIRPADGLNITHSGAMLIMPGEETLSTTGVSFNCNNSVAAVDLNITGATTGFMNYSWYCAASNASISIRNVSLSDTVNGTTRFVNISSGGQKGPAVLILEERAKESGYPNAIAVPLTVEGTTSKIAIDTPMFSDTNVSLKAYTSDSYLQRAIDRWGTYVTYDSKEQNKVIISYPDDQMYASVLVTSAGATVTTTAGATGVAELGNVVVKDSEIAQVQTKNLIVVGGNCVNSVAASLLGKTAGAGTCLADFTTASGAGAGQFIIKALTSPYATGKVALLVAGYQAADTTNAVTYLTTKKPATDVGTILKGTSATEATLVTS